MSTARCCQPGKLPAWGAPHNHVETLKAFTWEVSNVLEYDLKGVADVDYIDTDDVETLSA